jgi:NAD(P)-dependent dehydrogenase (short-subunit alcohol dehydrogenase family)
MRVGVIGTGTMGRPIAVNCLAAGHSVIVYNRTRARADELRSFVAEVADSVGEACRCEVVITIMADDTAIGPTYVECRIRTGPGSALRLKGETEQSPHRAAYACATDQRLLLPSLYLFKESGDATCLIKQLGDRYAVPAADQ